jgi:small subunit ribosomal protein S17
MKKTLTGIVTSCKNEKSCRVDIKRLYRHPKYGKIVHGRTVCHVHDENNDCQEGDVVEIIECRPRSKTKRWELVKIVKSAKAAAGIVDEPVTAAEIVES